MASLPRLAAAAGLATMLAVCGQSVDPAPCGAACDPGPELPPRAPISLFQYDRNAPLDFRQTPMTSPAAGVRVYAVSYLSPAGGRATGWLGVPEAAGPHAGIVLMHGLPGTAEGALSGQGLDLVAAGAVVLAVDAPWARRGELPDLTPRDSADQVQLMWDLQRAVDGLLARSDVDGQRLAYVGGSYGGAMGGLFVAIERRLAAAVLFVPDGGLVSHFTTQGGAPEGPLATLGAAERNRWIEAMWTIEPIRFVGESSPTPLLIQNGTQDALVTTDDAQALQAAAGEPKTIRWYDAGHGLTPTARADRVAWLTERLSLRQP
ncbi:MAG: alpha/beta hydrolase family protein [Gemmatimonadales bacterium]